MTGVEVNVSQTSLHHARLEWNEAGTPVSSEFGDVYFSNDNGLNETRYVFLQQNRLPERFSRHDRDQFVIAETGFGTGLNFLASWQAFAAHLATRETGTRRLHFTSFEKFPLTRPDLAKALAAWPELSDFSEQLVAQWPLALPGCHRLLFDEGHVTLDLWFGDIKESLPRVPHGQDGLVDAWFLDGFAPAKNPEMWTPELFAALARLARADATLATFTCAGFVRRGLIEAGWAMEKVKGYGSKREMLAGTRRDKTPCSGLQRAYPRPAGREGEVLLVGGGIASAMTALSLVRRGRAVTLLCADAAPAGGASGNRQGALYPLLGGEHDTLSRFYAAAFPYARERLVELAARHEVAFELCGVTQLAYDDKSTQKIAKLLTGPFPAELVYAVPATEMASELGLPTGCAGVAYPRGGWLCPADLTRAALAEAATSGLLTQHYGAEVTHLSQHGDLWVAEGPSGRWQAPNLVVAAGHRLPELIPFAALPLYPVRGQVSHARTNPALSRLKQVLCYDGYLSPGHQGRHCIGASYGRNQTGLDYREEEQASNRERLIACLPEQEWPLGVDLSDREARVGVRSASRDHLPVMGPVAVLERLEQRWRDHDADPQWSLPTWPGLFVLGALGSRGLCSAPLCGELLAAEICGEPLGLDRELLDALHPARYWSRKLLKGKPLGL
ncbi:bifunctional tRNA (5-methylaminomethyl-2-thiouridine)(34)-methyltransferase MnmD/FAD-dependent 5-carboxymethylaminomethyl-2-thiouridine(34) oxidoreductase MnmC [Aeromonas schubertii]|uniref:bifunctional tRNA (5-methylaminomethyl-2-thiouridine)(34)-methyltransferase MnmD/FAD-dependent 5-carboxymethylaminomethyl-2-thiouridine(34) oxidoreductase MnmC n=1 Tax=Aeromonas schubertii TaxID=652 RepID=UPI0018742395|nr:bifunctional tRNA (5-methylaminomethyl-2-thiouridine)(34)-methyltransferase MnmD/FAD-dependent 5-carboxymethylaminomethyl-2-thiouridine(34) oxidoreductase MnmC [Aeromonas schubertii]